MQQRYYDPEIMRFNSPDPVGPEEDFIKHFSRYNYALNNPVRYTDPDGRYGTNTVIQPSCNTTNTCVSPQQADKGVAKDAKQVVGVIAAAATAGGGAALATATGATVAVSAKATEVYVKGKIAVDATVNAKNATSVAIAVSAKAEQVKTAVVTSPAAVALGQNMDKVGSFVNGFVGELSGIGKGELDTPPSSAAEFAGEQTAKILLSPFEK
jgi:hypothetical protein